jgi:ABC-type branched-subunit amino acid transport system permease subunit
MRTVLKILAVALVAAGLIAIGKPYLGFLVGQLAVLVIAVASLNLLSNVAGMLSLASAAFLGVGGYAALIFLTEFGVPLPASIVLAVAAGWLVGWLMGLVAVRLSGISLAIATFGFVQIFQVLIKQEWEFSGSGYGLIVPPLEIPGIGPLTMIDASMICVFAGVVVLMLTSELTHSRIGRAWYAVKDHPIAAEMQGINLTQTRAQAFALTGAMTTLAGCLQALLLGITNPNLYTIDNSIGHLAMMVVGGSSGSVVGPILGPAVLFLLPEYLDLGAYREVLYGGALLAVLILAPAGLAGAWHYAVRRLRHARFRKTRGGRTVKQEG